MSFIELGKHKIEVSVSNGLRMIRLSDTKELLDLKDEEIRNYFIDAGFLTDKLFEKIYISKNATIEQEIIHRGLCMVGIYPLIDEVCKVDLRGISYVDEFKKNSLRC